MVSVSEEWIAISILRLIEMVKNSFLNIEKRNVSSAKYKFPLEIWSQIFKLKMDQSYKKFRTF